MRFLNAVFGHVDSTSGGIANRDIFKSATVLTALVCSLSLVGAGFGEENKSSEKPKSEADAAAKPAPSREPTRRAGNNRRLREHGALGVLLSQSGDVVSVSEVIPGSPAEKAGLNVGDEIRSVDDERIRSTQDLTDVINASVPGTQVDLTIRRNGRRQVVRAELAAWESTFGSRQRIVRNEAWLNQRIRALEQQIQRQQQEINALRNLRQVPGSNTGDLQQWWERVHHGESDNDPALFQ